MVPSCCWRGGGKYLNKIVIVIEIGKYKLGKEGSGKGDLNN
jgi:hypothetical protein